MGVPFFFRWLVRRYSQILSTAKTGCDYFYLDFNGILHTFFHPDDGSVPANFEEVLLGVCAALDSLVALIQPQKFLFIALDGVAPRAKLNHQRGRRFRSANEKENDEKNPLSEPSFLGSNAITPGTTFMAFAGTYLAQHIAEKIKADADWFVSFLSLIESNSLLGPKSKSFCLTPIPQEKENIKSFNLFVHKFKVLIMTLKLDTCYMVPMLI